MVKTSHTDPGPILRQEASIQDRNTRTTKQIQVQYTNTYTDSIFREGNSIHFKSNAGIPQLQNPVSKTLKNQYSASASRSTTIIQNKSAKH